MRKWSIAALLAIGIAASGDSVWETDFKKFEPEKWKIRTLIHEITDTGLRIQVAPEAPGNYGNFFQYVPPGGKDYYLQVEMGGMENSTALPRVNNISTGGKSFGSLLPGWNTFSMVHVERASFALAFSQNGSGKQPGPWVDYRSARIVRIPKDGLTVTPAGGDGVVGVGAKLIFRYYASKPLAGKTLTASCFIAPQFTDYRFNAERGVILTDTGKDGVYEGQIEITADALSYSSDPKNPIMASVEIDHTVSYYTLPFAMDIKTANAIPKELSAAANPQVRRDRQLWFDLTRGTNPAQGKAVLFNPPPDYRLTVGESDSTDLTDGKLTDRTDDKVWFDRNAVGWYMGNGETYLKLDLGNEQPIERLVIRCLGGTAGNFKFPKQFDAYVSKDGNTWFNAASMQKLMPCESDQSNFKNYYYLEENAAPYATRMYPFALGLQADARYILLKITGETASIFTDELALVKAETKSPDHNRVYSGQGQAIPMEGLIIRPRVTELAAIHGLPAPQRFVIQDMRPMQEKTHAATLVLELPDSLRLLSPKVEAAETEINGKRYTRVELPLPVVKEKIQNPVLFLETTGKKADAPAFIYARSNGQDQFKTELPVKIVELPAIKPFDRLHVSLSWMGEGSGMSWPDFLANWRKLGFNTVSSFPRYWTPGNTRKQQEYLDAARKAGFKIVMNDSAFHEMMRGHEEGSEIYCQIPGEKHKILCPSYRGPYYAKEMERITRCTRDGKPDFIFYDIECWHHSAAAASKCTRCREALEKSGKPLNEFLLDCGTETMRDVTAAAKAGAEQAGIPMPEQGSYNRHAWKPFYAIEDFNRIYPEYIKMAQPSLYVAGRAGDVQDSIRNNHKLLKNKKIIPWLTAGTYGEFDSFKIEQMILEAFMNGAGGITYYEYHDFTDSPLDFYYHAKALAQIRPYENLIADGEILEPSGSNDKLLYSGIRKDGEMLLLVGNYVNAPEKTTVKLPFRHVSKITDLQTGKTVDGTTDFSFEVPKGGIRLFHIAGKN